MGVEYLHQTSAYVHRWTCDQCGRHVRQITFGVRSNRVPRDWRRVDGKALCAWCGVNADAIEPKSDDANGGGRG